LRWLALPRQLQQKASTKAITSFNFSSPAETGTIAESDHSIEITVPFGTDVTAIAPIIVQNGVSITPASGLTKNFNGPIAYTVTAADGSSQVYTVYLTLNGCREQTATQYQCDDI
jgi:hypothetical protein